MARKRAHPEQQQHAGVNTNKTFCWLELAGNIHVNSHRYTWHISHIKLHLNFLYSNLQNSPAPLLLADMLVVVVCEDNNQYKMSAPKRTQIHTNPPKTPTTVAKRAATPEIKNPCTAGGVLCMRQRNGRFTTVLVITRVMYIIARAASANPGEVLIRWEFVSRCDVGIVMTSLRVIGNSYSVPWTYKRRPVRSSRAGPQGAGECACGSPASEAHDTLATADRRPGPWADRLATARPAIRLTGRTLYHTVVQ